MKRPHFALPEIYGEPLSFYEILSKLCQLLNDETYDRKNADDELQNNINAEATAREQADTSLRNGLTAETNEREQADSTLQQNINAEATAREQADNTLQQNINAEATARELADNTLQQNINAEANAREQADASLRNDLTTETNAREQEDNTLQQNINNEKIRATNRENEIESSLTMHTQEAVNNWLNEHPEATTTVQDGAITEPKIHTGFLPYIKNAYVTPEMFGAVGDGVTDDTEAIQSAINAKKPIHFGAKTYCATHLTIKNGTKLIGERGRTFLQSLPSNEESFITMDNGACEFVTICNLTILGNNSNINQNGLYLKASFPIDPQEYQHGGLWRSDIYNVAIREFSGVGFALIGGSNNYMLPMQFNYFKEIEVDVDPNKFKDAIPILIEGQVEQSVFIRMSGSSFPVAGSNLKAACIMRRNRNGDIIESDLGGLGNTFIQCYFGNADVGLYMERTWRSAFINCYYENVNTPIKAVAGTHGVKIIGANYSFLSSSDGIFAKCQSESYIEFIGVVGDQNGLTKIDGVHATITGGNATNIAKQEFIAPSDTVDISAPYVILHSDHDLKKIISKQQFITIHFTQVTNIINGDDIITLSKQDVTSNYGIAYFVKVGENKYIMVSNT